MISFKQIEALQQHLNTLKQEGKRIGFVPTMGALHKGHLSLIQAAKDECDIVVCSIFVNPTQFNNKSDLEKYPITLENDSALLEHMACDVLFLPKVDEVYPNGFTETDKLPDLGAVLTTLEGKFRPGHFEGMMQVVSILLDIVQPSHLFMGLKDYQQFAIVSLMVKAQNRTVEMRGMPTIREDHGLAMSSRNERLSKEGRAHAKIIYETLALIQAQKELHTIYELEKLGKILIEELEGAEVEYFRIVNATSLENVDLDKKSNLIALCAVWYEGVRLIDNLIL